MSPPHGNNGGAGDAAPEPVPECGMYCGEGIVLRSLLDRINILNSQTKVIDNRSGEVLAAAIKAEQAADRAATEAKKARQAAEAVTSKMCEGANMLMAKYSPSSDTQPISFDEEDASELTQTQILTPKLSLARIRKAEQEAKEAQQGLVKAAVDKALTERELDQANARAKKLENLRVWMVAITSVLVALGSLVTWFLGRK